ncbi:hypothetical protein SCB49_14410 [unidentified eubacterium SCB49]|nr:hypothetical protein SCB49_14410 [unidentified eubacterium SCB49]
MTLKPLTFLLIIAVLFINSCKEKQTLPGPAEAGWKGKVICEVLEDNENLRSLKCTFPPGVGHEKHIHPTHIIYTLKGSTFRITSATGTREVHVKTGSYYYNDHDNWHEVLNIGDSTAVFLIMEPK